MWINGKICGYTFRIKRFDNKGPYGINGGRISYLELFSPVGLAAKYEHISWTQNPVDDWAEKLAEGLIAEYN